MSNIPSNEQIEARAYELYLERGCEDGHDVDDWLAAERELAQRRDDIESLFDQEQPEVARLGRAATASSRRR
jgi:hypothetical protein